MKKIAILILTYEQSDLYKMLENKLRSTWASQTEDNCSIWYYYGDSNEFSVEGNVIRCPFPESYLNIGKKTICAFEYLLTQEFDYLIRPNSSSFVNLKQLSRFIQELPKEKFYGGKPIPFQGGGVTEDDKKDGLQFCPAGCGYILSRDLVQLIVDKKEEWPHYMIDDMALCRLLKNYGVDMVRLPFLDIDYTDGENIYRLGSLISDEEFDKFHHIRTEAPSMNRDMNMKILESCYNKIKKINFKNEEGYNNF